MLTKKRAVSFSSRPATSHGFLIDPNCYFTEKADTSPLFLIGLFFFIYSLVLGQLYFILFNSPFSPNPKCELSRQGLLQPDDTLNGSMTPHSPHDVESPKCSSSGLSNANGSKLLLMPTELRLEVYGHLSPLNSAFVKRKAGARPRGLTALLLA